MNAICLKCLARKPPDRYGTAEELRMDLDRYRDNRPVAARRAGVAERLLKWRRRNPGWSAAIAATTTSLIAVVAILAVAVFRISAAQRETERQLVEVKRERDRADHNFNWSKSAIERTVSTIRDYWQSQSQVEMRNAQVDILKIVLDFYDSVVAENADETLFEEGRAEVYWWLTVARSPMGDDDKRKGLADARNMQAVAERMETREPTNPKYRFLHGWSLGWQANLLYDLDRKAEAEDACDRAISILLDVERDFPTDAAYAVRLGACYMNKARLLMDQGRLAEAKHSFDLGVAYLTKPISSEDARVQGLHFHIAYAESVAMKVHDWESVAKLLRTEVDLEADVDIPNPHRWYDLAIAHLANGDVSSYRRACEEMYARFGELGATHAAIAERVVYACVPAADSISRLERLELLAENSLGNWPEGNHRLRGAVAYRMGRFEEAVGFLEEGDRAFRAWDWFFLAMAYHQLGKASEARRCLDEATRWKTSGPQQWNEVVETKLLRAEAEKLIQNS